MNNNNKATFLGILTSLVLALEWVDFDNLDYSSVNTWIKLATLILPVAGGYFSQIKEGIMVYTKTKKPGADPPG